MTPRLRGNLQCNMIYQKISLISTFFKLFCKLASRVCETRVQQQNRAFENRVSVLAYN